MKSSNLDLPRKLGLFYGLILASGKHGITSKELSLAVYGPKRGNTNESDKKAKAMISLLRKRLIPLGQTVTTGSVGVVHQYRIVHNNPRKDKTDE